LLDNNRTFIIVLHDALSVATRIAQHGSDIACHAKTISVRSDFSPMGAHRCFLVCIRTHFRPVMEEDAKRFFEIRQAGEISDASAKFRRRRQGQRRVERVSLNDELAVAQKCFSGEISSETHEPNESRGTSRLERMDYCASLSRSFRCMKRIPALLEQRRDRWSSPPRRELTNRHNPEVSFRRSPE
jgi:hypothetical protein